jgi:GLPGLI family protein
MIKIIVKTVLWATLLVSSLLTAQNFQGIAEYETKTIFEGKITLGGDADPVMQKQIEESMKSAFEKKYQLMFNTVESLYKEEEKLEAPQQNSFGMVMSFSGGGDVLYRNIKEQQTLEEKEFFSKEFLVINPTEKLNWTVTDETKKIGQYQCMKATMIFPVTQEQLESYEKMKAKQEKNPTQFMVLNEPKDRVVEAWFTMDIPVSHGPADFWGLPGLIMEVHDGNTIYLCSKITLNPKEKFTIKKPKSGQKVSGDEYEEIVKKKLESMKDKDGNIRIERSIQIGG